MASNDLQEIVRRALACKTTPERWRLAQEIAAFGREGLQRAESLLREDDASSQRLAVEILGRVDPADEHSCAVAAGILTTVLSDGREEARGEAAVNLARLPNVDLVTKLFALRYDTRAGVRLALALSLSANTPLEIAALVALSADSDAEVRSWATFRLAESGVDTDEVRSALRERLADSEVDVRGEALLGLLRRTRDGTFDMIRAELERGEGGEWVAEAALLAPHHDLAPLLRRQLEATAETPGTDYRDTYAQAIAACEVAPPKE